MSSSSHISFTYLAGPNRCDGISTQHRLSLRAHRPYPCLSTPLHLTQSLVNTSFLRNLFPSLHAFRPFYRLHLATRRFPGGWLVFGFDNGSRLRPIGVSDDSLSDGSRHWSAFLVERGLRARLRADRSSVCRSRARVAF